jgi:phosphoglycerate dehydrogenase-like enzyme
METTNSLPTLSVDLPLSPAHQELFVGKAQIVGPDGSVASANGAVAGAAVWDGDMMDRYDDLQVISRAGIGFDAVDLMAATERGIVVCNAPEAPTVSTAEHAVALMMTCAKTLSANQRRQRDGVGGYAAANTAMELEGRTLGLIGYGRISRRVGAVAAALGMNVVAADPYIDPTSADVNVVSFDELLAQSDVVSLHAPATDATRGMIDAKALAAMRPGAILVNTARGVLVDHTALVAALESGHLGGAGLDVTDPEPLPLDHPLLARDDVVVTPHIASSSDRGKLRLYEHAIENALGVIAGHPPTTCVNPEVLPTRSR